MEVLVEKNVVAPGRVALKQRALAKHGTPAFVVEQEQAQQTPLDLVGHFAEVGQPARTGARRYFALPAPIWADSSVRISPRALP
jgi:hypothetical protein